MRTTQDTRKAELRKALRAARDSLSVAQRAEADARILARLVELPSYTEATLVATYLSFGSEVDTRALMDHAWEDGKTVALPRCVRGTRRMRWYRVEGLEGLVPSRLGVLEPDPVTFEEVDPLALERAVAVVPGLAFDAAGYRLGYGGGYYDTFLSAFRGASVGLCRTAQLVNSLCELGVIAAHDLPVNKVVSG